MSTYICKICGKEFDRVGNAVYCEGPHFRPCPVCESPVRFHRPSDPVTCCSSKCKKILADTSKSSKVKFCKECGKGFHPRQASQIYCKGPHTTKCEVCGKLFEYSVRPSEKPKTCSRECQEKLRSVTTLDRYGVKNVSELDSVKQKISEKNSSETVKAKRARTSLEHWGVDNPAKNPDVAAKMSSIMSSESYLLRREQTCIDRYGFKSPMMSDAVKNKKAATSVERYGRTGRSYSKNDIKKMMTDSSKVENYMSFRKDPETFIKSNFEDSPTISQLESILGVTNTPIYKILIEHECRDLLKSSFSSLEDSVVEFLTSQYPDIEIVRCDRTIINPQEIDIYLPQYKLGIECNPVSTHNSSFVDPWGEGPKSPSYHRHKSLAAMESGIFLYHIFGYEWNNYPEVVKSMLTNLIGRSSKIGARETYVDEVTYEESKRFLDVNHRQRSCGASIRIGLRIRGTDELVALMTFGRLRHTMGRTDLTCNVYELSRFCNKLDLSVIGGASKLFNYFINHYEFDEIVSFSDISHTRGNLYKILGFTEVSEVPPSYTWVDKYDQIYYNRVSCQKSNLKKLLQDSSIDVVNKTEKQIMEEHGFAQVYDSGKVKWSYARNKEGVM